MSLMSMRRKMASKKTATTILWVLIVVFLAGIALWNVQAGPAKPDNYQKGSGSTVIATVAGERVTEGDLDKAFDNLQQAQGQADIMSVGYFRQQALNSVIDQHLQAKALKDNGVRVNAGILRKKAREIAEEQLQRLKESAKTEHENSAKDPKRKGKLKSEQELYVEQMASFMNAQNGQDGTTPVKNPTEGQFVRWFVNDFVMAKQAAEFEQYVGQLLIGERKVKELPVDPASEEFAKAYTTKDAKVSLILINATAQTKDALKAAEAKAKSLHEEIVKNAASFDAKAKEVAADPAGAGSGSIGWLKESYMPVPPMVEYLAYTTKAGSVSPLTMITNQGYQGSTVGYGFVKVDETRDATNLPKDFSWKAKAADTMKSTGQQFAMSLGQSYLALLRYQGLVVPKSKELLLYEAQLAGKTQEADKLIREAMNDTSLPPIVRHAFMYQVAQTTKDNTEKIQLLSQSVPSAGQSAPRVQLELGRAYLAAGRTAEAKEQFGYVEIGAGNMDATIRQDLRAEYKKMGDTDGMKRMDDWLAENEKGSANGLPGQLGALGLK